MIDKKHIIAIVSISIIFKLFLIFLTTNIFHSFIDGFDINIYLNYAIKIVEGNIPYIDFSLEYPPFFFIPVFISMLFLESFGLIFAILMVICDVITACCVYLIALKLYSKNKALLCGIIYACSFTAYFVLTKYDAFPTMLMILALYFYMYNGESKGHIFATVGLLAKWFPIIITPFFIIRDIKNAISFRDITKKFYASFLLFACVMLPLAFFGNEKYKFISMHLERGSQSVSFPFLIDHIIQSNIFSSISSYISAILLLCILYWFYKYSKTDDKSMILFSTLSLMIFLVFNKVLSPQYFLWIMPLFAITLVDTIEEMVFNYTLQAIIFIEFPLSFGVLYTNDKLFEGILPILYFSIKHLVIIYLLYIIIKKIKHNEYSFDTTKRLATPPV